MSPQCRSKQALLQGLRPQSHHAKSVNGTCQRHCIFCDIWKLAMVMASHVPLSDRLPVSSRRLRRSNSNASTSSSRSTETYDWEASAKLLEAQLQTQRARLASIISICTVEGAEECEGLRIAYDRCVAAVAELLYQERVLEETLLRSTQQLQQQQQQQQQQHQQQQHSSCAGNSPYYSTERRPSASRIGIAI